MISLTSILFPGTRSRQRRGDDGPLSDESLALAARARDRAAKEAFVEIVRRHQTAVCAVAYGVTGRIGLMDDIAQETFLKAWKQLPGLREPGKLKPWLATIAHGCAVDALQRERRHEPLETEEAQQFPCGAAMPDAAAVDADEARIIWEVLADLPKAARVPLVLFYREGQSIAAVAEALELSEDAVKQRLHRGREADRKSVV